MIFKVRLETASNKDIDCSIMLVFAFPLKLFRLDDFVPETSSYNCTKTNYIENERSQWNKNGCYSLLNHVKFCVLSSFSPIEIFINNYHRFLTTISIKACLRCQGFLLQNSAWSSLMDLEILDYGKEG
jgi:hypothetical protein